MPKQKLEKPNITFRYIRGEADFTVMRSILLSSTEADQIIETATVEDIRNWCAPSKRFDPKKDISIALGKGQDDENTEIGFSRVSWYTGKEGVGIYYQASYLVPEYRKQGIWSGMVKENERRLQEISANHPNTSKRFFQAWATETQKDWITVLKNEE